ncbi:MAG: hypothetical protein IJV00_07820 [Clostridia bacterium]|nr:hypothetical protein [Clostridia bacterium]
MFSGSLSGLAISPEIIPICALSGISWGLLMVFWLMSVRNGAYMMVASFESAGVVIPVVMSAALFTGEAIRINHAVGLCLLIAGVAVMNSYSRKLKGSPGVKGYLYVTVVGISYGLSEFAQKWYSFKTDGKGDSAVFAFYTYVFAIAVIGVFALIGLIGEKKKAREEAAKDIPAEGRNTENGGKKIKLVLFAFIMAVCTLVYTLGSAAAAPLLPATVLFPLKNGGDTIFGTAMSAIFLKEKLNATEIAGLALVFAALVLINL